MLPELDPEALHLFVFGPGTGEFVAVCAPTGRWLVVDGCGYGGTMYASALLDHYQAVPEVVVLTHPHVDHYKGLDKVIDDATQGEPETWPVLGLVVPPEADERDGRVDDLVVYLLEGGAEHVVAAILDRWDQAPEKRWTLQPDTTKDLGEARIRVLAPRVDIRQQAEQARQEHRDFDLNQLSAMLVVEWRDRRLVLGADLPEEPGAGWSSALELEPTLGEHDALKVPHHGSEAALHAPLLRREDGHEQPCWIVTPFASKDLPRLTEGGGGDQLLSHVEAFEATGLPRPYLEQLDRAEQRSIRELRPDGGGLVPDREPAGFPDCFVVVSLPPEGAPTIHRGPGSVQITR